jgi:membrane fusion protein (multidrug efflux system)
VLSGLKKGEQVVTHGTLRVRPGQSIEIKAVDDGQQPIDVLLSATPGGSGG